MPSDQHFACCELIAVIFCFSLILPGLTEALVTTADDLNCDFEANCVSWKNGSASEGVWRYASSLLLDAWHSIPRPFEGRNFAVASGLGTGRPARLYSDTLPCLIAPAIVTFAYWKNSIFLPYILPGTAPALTVALRYPQNSSLVYLSNTPDINEWGWKSFAVEIPTSDVPFQIVFEGITRSGFDVIGLDDIKFRGFINDRFCHLSQDEKIQLLAGGLPQPKVFQTASKATTPKLQPTEKLLNSPSFDFDFSSATETIESLTDTPSTTTLLPTTVDSGDETDPCQAVNCGFEGNSCMYEGTDGAAGAWVILQGRMGNPLTGIPGAAFGSYYAAAYSNESASTQILRSHGFKTSEPTVLTFSYYFASADAGVLKVCTRTVQPLSCLWQVKGSVFTADVRSWKRGRVLLKPGYHRVSEAVKTAVKGLEPHYYMGIDEVRLLRRSSEASEMSGCELVADASKL